MTINFNDEYPELTSHQFNFQIDDTSGSLVLTKESLFLVKILSGTSFGNDGLAATIVKGKLNLNRPKMPDGFSIDNFDKVALLTPINFESGETYTLHIKRPIFRKDSTATTATTTSEYYVVFTNANNKFYLIDCTDQLKDITDNPVTYGGTRKRRASKQKRKAKTPKRRKHAKRS
jgi:hypothetical protein